MTSENEYRFPTIIGYTVKKIKEIDPTKQVGKTVIQKMMFFLTRENIIDSDYTLYHYGPYSSEISDNIDYAKQMGIIDLQWKDEAGYYAEATEKLEKFKHIINSEETEIIDKVIKKYYEFKAIDLSLIATAMYLKDHYRIPEKDLPQSVHALKPNFSKNFINDVLKTSKAFD